MNRFTAEYWQERYDAQQTGWDAGAPTMPFVAFFDTLQDKNIRILIPGCGRAYEGELLWNMGFKNVWLIDLAAAAKDEFMNRVPSFPAQQFLVEGFFGHIGTYDLILEQTFFCALEPALRSQYALKTHELLLTGGSLVGLLFTFPLSEQGPPFGGSLEEYKGYFGDLFNIKIMEPCRNSIKPRQGNELFIHLQKEA